MRLGWVAAGLVMAITQACVQLSVRWLRGFGRRGCQPAVALHTNTRMGKATCITTHVCNAASGRHLWVAVCLRLRASMSQRPEVSASSAFTYSCMHRSMPFVSNDMCCCDWLVPPLCRGV